MARVGFILSIVWGSGLVFRLIFPEQLPGSRWLYAGVTLPSVAAWYIGVAQTYRRTTTE